MPKDELLLGTDNFNKVHGAGNNHHDDNTLQRETTAYWMAQELGLPANYKRFVAMYINGARRGSLMEDTQVPNDEVIESVFPDDSEGDLLQDFRVVRIRQRQRATGSAFRRHFRSLPEQLHHHWRRKKAGALSLELAAARAFTERRMISRICFRSSTPRTRRAGSAFVQSMDAVADVENWMRTFALEHAVGNWDSFGYRNEQNMFAYKPERGRWSLLIWDINIIFGGGTRGTPVGTNETLFEIDAADVPMNTLYNTPVYRRAYLAGPEGNCRRRFHERECRSGDGCALSGIPGQRGSRHCAEPHQDIGSANGGATSSLNWRGSIHPTSLSPLRASFTSATNLIAISGVAPVGVHTVRVNGIAWPVTWTSVTNWTIRVPLEQATNNLVVVGYDARGVPIGGTSNLVSVTYTGPIPRPEDHLVINEIVYNPTTPGGGFIEILNSLAHLRL